METITVENIKFSIQRKTMKNIILRIKSSDNILISAPHKVELKVIENFIRSKLDWVKSKLSSKSLDKQETIVDIKNGQRIEILGEFFDIEIINSNLKSLQLFVNGNKIIIHANKEATQKDLQSILNLFLKKKLEIAINKVAPKWEKIINVEVSEYRVRSMKTRWGTCNIAQKRIWINCTFARLPLCYLDYILVHELCHLLEPSHNARFYKFMDQFLPNWKEIKEALNNYKTL